MSAGCLYPRELCVTTKAEARNFRVAGRHKRELHFLWPWWFQCVTKTILHCVYCLCYGIDSRIAHRFSVCCTWTTTNFEKKKTPTEMLARLSTRALQSSKSRERQPLKNFRRIGKRPCQLSCHYAYLHRYRTPSNWFRSGNDLLALGTRRWHAVRRRTSETILVARAGAISSYSSTPSNRMCCLAACLFCRCCLSLTYNRFDKFNNQLKSFLIRAELSSPAMNRVRQAIISLQLLFLTWVTIGNQ